MKKKLFLILILVLVAVFAVACTTDLHFADATVVRVAVDGISKVEYNAGEEIDIQGATVIATYSDGEIKVYELTKEMLSGYDMNVAEENKVVTVTYGGQSTTFTVNVNELSFSSVSLASLPLRNQYVEGEKVSAKGARLAITYSGGKTVYTDVTDKMLEDYDNTRLGAQQIYVSYYNYRLSFTVTFVEKTVTGISVLREPYQASVFLGYGDDLSLAGMRLKLSYDNDLSPEVSAADILDDLRVYINDRYVRTEIARVAYFPDGYPETFTYTYSGDAMVRVGDFVTPTTELAGNGQLDNVVSKSFGVVKSIAKGTLTVSTVVTYTCTEVSVEEGEILLFDQAIGRYGSTNVHANAGGGIVTKVENGVVTMQTTPVGQFSINVQDRSYESMVISTMPITTKYASSMKDITQGDTIDLSTGAVTVTYDNGEKETYPMNHTLIKVVNSDDDLLRSEIPGFSFTSIDDVSNLPTGQYELLFGVKHTYPEDRIGIVVSVIDENGKNMFVRQNDKKYYVSLEEKTNYTVSLTATLTEAGEQKVTEAVYHLATVGAGVRRSQLDITAAGRHRLNIIYSGIKTNSIDMIVQVIQRYPVRLNIVADSDNITDRTFWLGTSIPLTTVRYTVTYNNGDESEETGVTADMVGEGCSLECTELTSVGNRKRLFFTIPDTDVSTQDMFCDVVPVPIVSVSMLTQPTDAFLMAPAAPGSGDVPMAGATLRIYYADGTVAVVGNDASNELPVLLGNNFGERIVLSYPDTGDQTTLDIDDIYENGAHHTAQLTYYDKNEASGSCEFPFYVINKTAKSIRVLYRAEYFKDTYIQCEDWDLSGISISVTWYDDTSDTREASLDMIYDSSTDVVGTNIPFKFKFLGKVDASTLKITVKPRQETGLAVKRIGKDTYYNTDRELDLSQYRFSLSYNAGASAEVLGVSSDDLVGSRTKEGWWYELYDTSGKLTQFRRIGSKTVVLYHTSIFESDLGTVYNIVSTSFDITVSENETSDIDHISYDDTSVGVRGDYNILAETAAGWDLFLSEYDPIRNRIVDKYITVHYKDGTTGTVPITSEMLDYNSRVTTLGYTKVKILYKGFMTTVLVHVRNAVLGGISVEKTPRINYIAHSAVDLNGGIIKITFRIEEATGGELYKYLDLSDSRISVTGFNSDIDPAVDHVMQEITARFRDKAATYVVTIYNKQPINFIYQNTIFFYGNTKSAVVTPVQLIPEFDLPTGDKIRLWYVENSTFIPEADFAQYLIDHNDVTEGDFLKVVSTDGSYYVPRSALSSVYYIEPANPGYDYFIVMEVAGNDYYRAENYALQKFTIIPKVIEVSAVDYTVNAFVKNYGHNNAHDNAMAIYYLYRELSAYVNGLITGKIASVELLSPNASGFEIAVFVTADFDENDVDDMKSLTDVYAAIEDELTKTKSLNGIDISGTPRRGINVGYYNGKRPEHVSYRVAAGETLTRRNASGEDILELLAGALSLEDNYDYGVGERTIGIGTLFNKNYNVDFAKGTFFVKARPVSAYTVMPTSGSVTDLNQVRVQVDYVGGGYRIAEGEEISFFIDSGRTQILEELPTAAGTYTYYGRVGSTTSFVDDNGDPYQINFTIQYIKE